MAYNPVQSKDHEVRGAAKLLTQFRNKSLLVALLKSYMARIQELEDAAWEVILFRNIRDGEGVVLDWIGRIVGRQREGLVDDDYRLAIRAKIRINRTRGRPEDVIDVTRLSLPDGTPFTYAEAYPAGIVVTVLGQMITSVSVLFRNLMMTKAGGVRLFLVYSIDPPDDVFLLADYDPGDPNYITPVYDVDHGLGWDDDPTMGGLLSMIESS